MFAEAEPLRNKPTGNPTWNLNGHPLNLVGKKFVLTVWYVCRGRAPPKQTNLEPNLVPKWAPLGPGKKFILTRCGMLAEADPLPETNQHGTQLGT